MADDDIVLSGLSGRLPDSENIEEFAQNLFDGVDLVTEDDRRWTPGLHGLPGRNGKLKDLTHFDATFFGVHAKQAHLMDPQLRLLLELTHEALVDAGVAPAELRGSRTGVYVGVSNSETEELWTADPDAINGYALTGCCRAMFPNRISYTFDLKGPSYAIDTACSSSMFALSQAAQDIRSGACDAAIVGGANLCLKPGNSLNFHRLSMLSPEGRCAAFDAAGRGYVRSEACVVVLLQKRKDARREYATLRGARTNTDGWKEQGITFPNGQVQRALADETFRIAKLRPEDVTYVEAHGTGTKVGDPQEVNAIADLFCTKARKKPLLLGSVKSNMGHSEPASGLCSIAKVLVAMQRDCLPANLHFFKPNPDIPALNDGRIKVVDKNTPFGGGIVAINSFGFGGANAHIILEAGRSRSTKPTKGTYDIPRLLVASGRTEAAVEALLARGTQHPEDRELHALIDSVHAKPIAGHPQRGFALLTNPPLVEVKECESEARPVWFVFSGMGSQWAGMARDLMALPLFARSMQICADALKPHGIDLIHICTKAEEKDFENVINSFVSIAAVQVSLVDVLREAGIVPDGIIGHSVGEVGCAYADGSLTASQAVLCAYWRGRSIADAKLAPGAMAAVGLSWAECERRLPADVVPACHNSEDSVTVSGPPASIDKLVAQLASENIFARRVNSSGVAFHSKYIASAAPLLRKSLEKVIDQPKPRSSKWLSTSLPEDQWDSDLAKLSSAAYHVNNLLSPVRFGPTLQRVPERALLVELAPHALLQAVLRRALPKAACVPLLRKDAPNSRDHLLAALGRLYCAGGQPQLARLYPAVSFPVSRNTPTLASSVQWDHSLEWSVANYGTTSMGGENIIEYDLGKPEDAFVAGHNIDGRILFPATGYLTLVWRTLAKVHGRSLEETGAVMEDVQLRRATILSPDQPAKFLVTLLPGTGQFEIANGGSVAVTGTVRLCENASEELMTLPKNVVSDKDKNLLPLDSNDIYKELRLRGYNYEGIFQGIKKSDARGTVGSLAWQNNWISFMDTMLQFCIIGTDTRELYLPTRLRRVVIDPRTHLQQLNGATEGEVPVQMWQEADTVSAGGVQLCGVKTSLAPRRARPQPPPKLETYRFLPLKASVPERQDALGAALQLLVEGASATRLKGVEVALGRPEEALAGPVLSAVAATEPLLRLDMTLAAGKEHDQYSEPMQKIDIKVSNKESTGGALETDCHVAVGADVLARHGTVVLTSLAGSMLAQGLLILEEPKGALNDPSAKDMLAKAGLVLVSCLTTPNSDIILLKKKPEIPKEKIVLEVSDEHYDWVDPLKAAMKRAETEDIRVYVYTNKADVGILGMCTCLRGESGGTKLRAFQAPGGAKFSPEGAQYAAQVALDLPVNVLCDGQWGTHRHFLLPDIDNSQLQTEYAYVNTLTRGDLSSLRWIESDLRYASPDRLAKARRSMCEVHYAPLNFRDIMLATGKLPPDALPGNLAGQECILGLEFSGEVSGRRVMGMVAARGLATHVEADEGFLWEVPKQWSLQEAATVPVAYATAYYALSVRGRMAKGERVLIHAGTGGVGQAAIAIALHTGCEVFTTVGTPDKRAFLRERFPNLRDDHIGNSRDTSFERMVLQQTAGRGVDLVLNSLAGDKLLASVRCLGIGGRFLEIGKLDLSNDTPLGMSVFLKNTTFHGILLDALFDADDSNRERTEVVRCVAEGIKSGAVKPLPATVYTDSQLEEAFRFMATGKHIGKVLVQVRSESSKRQGPRLVSAAPRTYLRHDRTYVLVGGLGGFGLELANWLLNKGATNLVLNSRGGVRTGYQALCIRRWTERGHKVLISKTDCTTVEGARKLLKEASALGPVGGIFNLAAVLRDAFLEDLSKEDFQTVARPKIEGTKALDVATREMCPDLEYFVAFSSVSCGRGNPGQSNYGLANSAMERLCERRQRDGLPALAVQWGAIGEVGLVVEAMGGGSDTAVGGTLPQRMASCLSTLGALMAGARGVAASMVLADKRRAAAAPSKALPDAVANILGIKDITKVPQGASLAELGMDSLMGAEIKQTLERGYDVVLGVQEIRALTVAKLHELGAGASAEASPVPEKAAEDDEQLAQFATLGEIMPREPLVELPSAGAGAGTVFMVHPIEGVVDMLREIAAGVRGRAVGLQCTAEAPLGSLGALAEHYVKLVRQRQPRPPYTLLGYSFGAGVAFEMALRLERAGLAARLVLVDGAPSFVATHTKRGEARRRGGGDAAAESDALAYFLALLAPKEDVKRAAAELARLPSLDARVEWACSRAEAAGALGGKALREAAASFYHKLRAADAHEASGTVAAPVTLFAAERGPSAGLAPDLGLGALCAGPLAVQRLPASHRSIVKGEHARLIAEHVSTLLADCA